MTDASITPNAVPRRGDLPLVPTADAVFLLNVETGHYLMMEGTAREIWDLVDGRREVQEIVSHLMNEFDIDQESCTRDVSAFLSQLKDEGVIKFAAK